MQYIYPALWFVLSIMMLVYAVKENKVFYMISGFFMFMGVWWLANIFTTVNLFSGIYVWVFRSVVAVVLAITCYAYYKERKNKC